MHADEALLSDVTREYIKASTYSVSLRNRHFPRSSAGRGTYTFAYVADLSENLQQWTQTSFVNMTSAELSADLCLMIPSQLSLVR